MPSAEWRYVVRGLLQEEVQKRMLSILEERDLLNHALGVTVDESFCQDVDKWLTMMHSGYGERFPTLLFPAAGGWHQKDATT